MKRLTLAFTLALAAGAIAQWPTFHGNSQRNGQTTATGPADAAILWSYDLKGPMINSPAVGPDGTIYTGSVWDESLQPSAYIHAINPDGTMKWRFETGWFDDQTISSPALGPEGNVYVGAPNKVFYALNSSGAEIWRLQTIDNVVTHPVVAPNGTVYAKLDGFLFAFKPTGQTLWQFPIGSNTPGSPALALDGTIYVPGAGGLFAINPNGTQKWKFIAGDSYSSPAVANDGKVIYATSSLYAIDPATGTQVWVSPSYGITPYSAPAIDPQGNIYLIEDWEFRKFSPAGQLLWEQLFEYEGNRLERSWSAPIVDAAGRLYFGLGTGKRYALDSAKGLVAYNSSGVKLYNLLLPETPSTSSPAIAPDGTIYIGCLDGKLYAIGEPWQNVLAGGFQVVRGVVMSGGLPELLNSDDQYLALRPGITLSASQRPLVVEVDANLPTEATALEFMLESRSTGSSIRQWVEAFNFQTDTWVEVDARQTTLTDNSIAVPIPNTPEFVESGTRRVLVRLSYRPTAPLLQYPWTVRIDKAGWRMR